MFDKWSNRSIMAARDAANRNTRRRRSDELIRLRDENGRLRAEIRASLTAPADGCEGYTTEKALNKLADGLVEEKLSKVPPVDSVGVAAEAAAEGLALAITALQESRMVGDGSWIVGGDLTGTIEKQLRLALEVLNRAALTATGEGCSGCMHDTNDVANRMRFPACNGCPQTRPPVDSVAVDREKLVKVMRWRDSRRDATDNPGERADILDTALDRIAALTVPADGCEGCLHSALDGGPSFDEPCEECSRRKPDHYTPLRFERSETPDYTPTTEGDTSCKTCGEVGEHHPDCTPQPGEDT